MRVLIILILFSLYGCTLVMPLPTDNSNTDLNLDYKLVGLEIKDERQNIDTADLKTPVITFKNKIIKNTPPFTPIHKDSMAYVVRKQLTKGTKEVEVVVHLIESYKEFSVLPWEDKEKARCFAKLKIDLKYNDLISTASATGEYFVTAKDVNDKGFEQLYIRTLKNSVQTALNEFK